MPRRLRDQELCNEFAGKLKQAIEGKVRRKAAAAVLGVSRQMLDLYLKEKATPGSDVIVRAMKAWNFKLKYRGREFGAPLLMRTEEATIQVHAEQLPLPLKDAIHSLSQEDIGITLAKKEPDRIDLQVSIRFVS
jgi:DNA-binding phage protein